MTSADPDRQKLTQLRKLLIRHFNLDELRVLCFDLGLEYEDLPGDTRTTKMHGLVEYLQRRGELPRLLDEITGLRPLVNWPSFSNPVPLQEAESQPAQAGQKNFIHEKSGLKMVHIPAGEFLYGEYKQSAFLPDYWIAKTPVTNAHYARFVAAAEHETPSHWPLGKCPQEFANHPVVNVSWHDATSYAEWAGLLLPTEQQWEKAARGQDGRQFPWGNEWKPYANTKEADVGTTTPVGYYTPFGDSLYGCVDMSGNVLEWTNSWFDYEKSISVLRGGSWLYYHRFARVSFRYRSNPDERNNRFGFRVVSPVGSSF